MINSLSKDSHMGPRFCPPNLYSGRGAYKPQGNIVTKNKSNHSTSVTINKPAEPNFCGFFSAVERANLEKGDIELSPALKLLEEEVSDLGGLVERVQKFLSEKESSQNSSRLNKRVSTLVKEAVDSVYGQIDGVSESTKTFLNAENNKQDFSKIIQHAKKLLKIPDPKKPINQKEEHKLVKELVDDSTKIIQAVEKYKGRPKSIFTSNKIHEYLKKAADNQLVFGSLFALVLTCTLRPITIVALPGQKKNKDDKKYAAAHSVASGIIGYVIALLISAPIADALKHKLGKDPNKYFKKETTDSNGKKIKMAQYLGDLNSERFRASKDFNKAKKVLNMIPDAILAIPKAVITIALIPIILKYVFGLEKNKKTKQQPIENKQIDQESAKTQKEVAENIIGGKDENISK